MKTMKKIIYILAIIGLAFGACDKIEEPFLEEITTIGGDNNIQLQIGFLENLTGVYNLNVLITESELISAQKNDLASIGPVPDWLDYEHNHILRSSLTGSWGIELIENPTTDTTITMDIPFNIEDEWVVENLSVIVFISKAETREIIQVEEQNTTNSLKENLTKVILEEFTGHICVNCPEATILAHDLKESFGEQLILLSIHAGDLAVVGDAPFDTDYTTEAGNAIYNYYAPVGVPTGMVSRSDYQGSTVLFKDSWEPAINASLEMAPSATIEITVELAK